MTKNYFFARVFTARLFPSERRGHFSEISLKKAPNLGISLFQHYDPKTDIFWSDFGLRGNSTKSMIFADKSQKPNYFLEAKGKTPMETVGKVLPQVEKIIDKFNPDAFLILGDTNSCLSSIAAKRKKVPIFHMEAGNRCFDMRVPEETNRKIVDHISETWTNKFRQGSLKFGRDHFRRCGES